jgi:hypothetical protein
MSDIHIVTITESNMPSLKTDRKDSKSRKTRKNFSNKIIVDSLITTASRVYETHAQFVLPKTMIGEQVEAVQFSEKDNPNANKISDSPVKFGNGSRILCPDNWLTLKVFVQRTTDKE